MRQCIQGLAKIVHQHKDCLTRIVDKIISIDIMQRKETQRKILLLDILNILCAIRKLQPDERIDSYIHTALTGGILDSKSKKMIAAL